MSPPAGQTAASTCGTAGRPLVLLPGPWWGIIPAVTGWAADLAWSGVTA